MAQCTCSRTRKIPYMMTRSFYSINAVFLLCLCGDKIKSLPGLPYLFFWDRKLFLLKEVKKIESYENKKVKNQNPMKLDGQNRNSIKIGAKRLNKGQMGSKWGHQDLPSIPTQGYRECLSPGKKSTGIEILFMGE